MNEFYIDGNKYSYMKPEDAIKTDFSFLEGITNYKKSKYLNLGSGFDIETTNFFDEKAKCWRSTMWCWQWSFDNITIIGRTWEEFVNVLYKIYEKLDLGKKRVLCVLDHNLPFEWSFIKRLLPVEMVLSKTKRDIMMFKLFDGGMEWRDTAILTRFSLAKMAKNYHLGIEKLKGDLDYSLIRHSETPFQNKQEIAYCINDVQILQRFFHKYIVNEFLRYGYKIPLTQTGIPRFALKRALRKSGEFARRYREFIGRAFPSEEFYNIERKYLFRGGFNHANILVLDSIYEEANELLEGADDPEMGSLDIKSSYPAQIWESKFGSVYEDVSSEWFEEVKDKDDKFFEDIGFIGYFKIEGIQTLTPHSIESKHKLVDYSDDAIFDNGRLVSASWVVVLLLETDFLNYRDFYKMKKINVIWIKKALKQFLPDFILRTVYQFFQIKESMPKDSVEYARAKEKLNSIFGCMSTGLQTSDFIYWNGDIYPSDSEELPEDIRQKPKTFDSVIKKQFLLPIWACQVAAFGRRRLLRLFKICAYDALYGDTDSCKLRHYKKYMPQIEIMNNEAEIKNRQTAERLGVDAEPVKNLNKFCFEGEYSRFKTLGAKRYLYETKPDPEHGIEKEIHSVVAGMKRGSFLNYCEEKNVDPFKVFSDKLYLSPEFSEKITSKYSDEPFDYTLTDYTGRTKTIHESSCCALFAIPFEMKVDPDFIALSALLKRREERKREVYHGIL